MNQKKIVEDFCNYLNQNMNDFDFSEIDDFLEHYDEDDHNEIFDLVNSVTLTVVSRERLEELADIEYRYKNLQN